MRNTLGDLNNHLFMQLERLSEEGLETEQLELEMKRSKSISEIAKNIIMNANLVLESAKFRDDRLNADATTPKMLEG